MRRPAEALAELDRALRADPDSPVARYERGMAPVDLGRGDEALAALDRAGRLGAEPGQVACGRAMALSVLGRFPEALAEAERAAQTGPGDEGIKAILERLRKKRKSWG